MPNKKPQLPPPLKKVSHLSANFGPTVPNLSPVHHQTSTVTGIVPDINIGDSKLKPLQNVKQDTNSSAFMINKSYFANI